MNPDADQPGKGTCHLLRFGTVPYVGGVPSQSLYTLNSSCQWVISTQQGNIQGGWGDLREKKLRTDLYAQQLLVPLGQSSLPGKVVDEA